MKKDNEEWDSIEVKTPEHDKLIIWLMNNAQWVVQDIGNFKEGLRVEIDSIRTEEPVINNQYIVGYIDLVIEASLKGKHEFIEVQEGYYGDRLKVICKHCKLEKEEIVLEDCIWKQGSILVEVKPNVENFGSLIRQINKYQTYYHEYRKFLKTLWIVFTKSCSEEIRNALMSQNVLVSLKGGE